MIVVRLRGNLVLYQPVHALHLLFSLPEAHPGFGQGVGRGNQLRLRQAQAGLDIRIVQAREELPLLHFHPLLDEHLHHFGGDLG